MTVLFALPAGVIDAYRVSSIFTISGVASSSKAFDYSIGSASGTTAACGGDGATYPGSSYCYKASNAAPKTFLEAEAECIRWGGHLASVHGEAEGAFVASLIANETGPLSTAWIGYSNVLNGNQPDEGLRIAQLQGAGAGPYTWTDGSASGYTNWVYSGPLHAGARSCALLGRGDWWVTECGVETGRLCAGRTWGSWGGGWLDVVGLPFSDEAQICYQDQAIGTTAACTQPEWVGTNLDDPCR